jgi:hypothetical protein
MSYNDRLVHFVGQVGELGGIGDIYTADLRTDGLNGFRWRAIVSRERWKEKNQPFRLSGFQNMKAGIRAAEMRKCLEKQRI